MKEFRIVTNIKDFISSIDDVVYIIPNRDRVLKTRIYDTCYDLLYSVYFANYEEDKRSEMYKILSLISMIDFYLERCLKKKYITSKLCERKSNELRNITKMVYGWIKYESGNK